MFCIVKRLVVFTTLIVLILYSPSSFAMDDEDRALLRRNTVVLGQVVACVVKIEAYAEKVDSRILNTEEIRRLTVYQLVGDTVAIMAELEKIFQSTSDSQVNSFHDLIQHASNNVPMELSTGLALLQMLGCGLMLKDYNIID